MQESEARATAELLKAGIKPDIFTAKRGSQSGDDVPFAIVPEGMKVESLKHLLDEQREFPERRIGTTQLADLKSFTDYVQAFKDAHSLVFMDETGTPSLTAVFDAHHPGPNGTPRHQGHRCMLPLPYSTEFLAWRDAQKRPFDTGEFANFLEERIVDVADPEDPQIPSAKAREFANRLGVALATPQAIMSLSKGLEINVDARVVDQGDVHNGERKLVFEESHKDSSGKPVNVPRAFIICVPLFEYAREMVVLPVRLSYRVQGGEVRWHYVVHRVDETVKYALRQVVDEVEENAKVTPVYWGKPPR